MFIDELEIEVQSGRGGAGCSSFRREKYVPFGGPDGGDGGHGGSVIIRVNAALNTLLPLRNRKRYRAKDGARGSSSNCTGASADDLILEVPRGTMVRDLESGRLLADLTRPDDAVEVVRGGRGGKGNARFVTSTRQAPRYAQPGEPGETARIRLELKMMADVGLVGLPNAGKSTLIVHVSAARPKIADYPFTTLKPSLGVVRVSREDSFVIADIPGIIRDAHQGTGLGLRFLRHIERTRVLLILLDPSDPVTKVTDAYEILMGELESYRAHVSRKPKIVAFTKCDLNNLQRSEVENLKSRLQRQGIPCFTISAMKRIGIPELVAELGRRVKDPTLEPSAGTDVAVEDLPPEAETKRDPLDEL